MTGSYPVFVLARSWLMPLYVNIPANYKLIRFLCTSSLQLIWIDRAKPKYELYPGKVHTGIARKWKFEYDTKFELKS